MIKVGIDTSVLIGLLDTKDIWHSPVTALKDALQAREVDVVLFDCVLAEAISTMARRIHEQRRTANLDQLITRITTDDLRQDILWILPDVPTLADLTP